MLTYSSDSPFDEHEFLIPSLIDHQSGKHKAFATSHVTGNSYLSNNPWRHQRPAGPELALDDLASSVSLEPISGCDDLTNLDLEDLTDRSKSLNQVCHDHARTWASPDHLHHGFANIAELPQSPTHQLEPPIPSLSVSDHNHTRHLLHFPAVSPSDQVVSLPDLVSSLLLLAHGMSTPLFPLAADQYSFTIHKNSPLRCNEIADEAREELSNLCLAAGQKSLRLRRFYDGIAQRSTTPAALIALGTTIRTVLVLQQQVSWDLYCKNPSIHGLRVLCHGIDHSLAILLDTAQATMTDTQDKTIIERTRSVLMSPDTNGTAFYAVRDAILSRISRPLVQQVLHVCGLLKPSLLMDSHAPSNHVQDLVGFGEDCLDGTSDHVSSSPSLLADEELITVREILRNCRLLDLNAGNHPLLMKSISPITEADLNRRRSAIDPDEILKKAQNYEAEIMSALHYSNVDSSRAPPHASMDKRMGMQRIGSTTTIEALDVVRNASTKLLDVCGDDDLLEALRQDFHTLNTSPRQPSSHEESFSMLTPFQPLFVTQLRLVTGANLRIFLREENLESHLDTHFQFHLLGNRTFLKRLQMTLFDTKATIGPRNLVQGNFAVATDAIDQHWPPGTVQLWNALSGLFSETYQHRTAESSWSKRAAIAGIPGHVNVAVREVDQPERTEIMDPLSTRALDFLRLRSTHSAALSTIFDSEATQHYDDIFRLLLVPLRQNHIIANLGRVILSRYANLSSGGRTAAARFANLCQAITASLSAYIFDLALLPPWDDMMNAIKVLCDDLDDEEADEVYGGRVKTSVTGLADLHHHTLTTIKSRLFLAPNKDIESRQIMQIYALLLQGNSSLARLLQPADTDIAEMANEVSILNELEASLRKAVQDLRHSLRNAQPFSSTGQARIKSLWRDFGMLPPEDDQHEIINMLERSLDLEPVFGSHDEPWNSS